MVQIPKRAETVPLIPPIITLVRVPVLLGFSAVAAAGRILSGMLLEGCGDSRTVGACGTTMSADEDPSLPTDLTGQNPRDSSGKRTNTDLPGNSEGVFDGLSGGKSTTLPDGTKVAPNGVRLRPGKGDQGPRIDIPGRGSTPPETIHFPPETK